MTLEIATREFKVDKRTFLPADKFDRTCPPVSVHLDETQIAALHRAQRIATFTPETYAIAIARRTPDMPQIGLGFTEAELAELGVKPLAARAAPQGRVKPEKPPATVAGPPVPVGPYFAVPYRVGKAPPKYDLVNADGKLLRDSRFASPASAQKFVDKLLEEAAKATSGAPKESQDDGLHVQPGADEPG